MDWTSLKTFTWCHNVILTAAVEICLFCLCFLLKITPTPSSPPPLESGMQSPVNVRTRAVLDSALCFLSSGNRRSSSPAYGFRLSPEEEMRRQRLHRFDSQRGNPALWTNMVQLYSSYPQTLSFVQKQSGHMTIPVAHACSGLSSFSHHESSWCLELVDVLRPGLFWQPPVLWEWHFRPCSLADRSSGVSMWGPVSTLPSLNCWLSGAPALLCLWRPWPLPGGLCSPAQKIRPPSCSVPDLAGSGEPSLILLAHCHGPPGTLPWWLSRHHHCRMSSRPPSPRRLGSWGPHVWVVSAVNLLFSDAPLPSQDVSVDKLKWDLGWETSSTLHNPAGGTDNPAARASPGTMSHPGDATCIELTSRAAAGATCRGVTSSLVMQKSFLRKYFFFSHKSAF